LVQSCRRSCLAPGSEQTLDLGEDLGGLNDLDDGLLSLRVLLERRMLPLARMKRECPRSPSPKRISFLLTLTGRQRRARAFLLSSIFASMVSF
jgi:hypothetical protein